MVLLNLVTINIYTVKLNGSKSQGKRFYFSTILSNQLLMGVNSRESKHGVGFSADATEDSLVYECALEDFKALLEQDIFKKTLVSLVSQWLENVFYGISENANHPDIQAEVLVSAGERVILRKGESISSQRKASMG